jgi:hypothetical protein
MISYDRQILPSPIPPGGIPITRALPFFHPPTDRKDERPMKTPDAIFLILLAFLGAATAIAQPPDTLWTRTYGGDAQEVTFSGTRTSDSCMVITGYTSSFGAFQCDAYLVKIDGDGDTLWTRMYGEDYYDYAMDIVESGDGGIVMAGKHSFPGAGIRKAWLLKTGADGDLAWEKNFEGSTDLETNSLTETKDGGFAVVGTTGPSGNNDAFLLRTDANGDSLWLRTYGGDQDEQGTAVRETPDSGFIVAGLTESYGAGNWDIWILRLDKNGDSLWMKTFGNDNAELAPTMIQCRNGDYIILSYISSASLSYWPVYLIRMRENGDTVWTREIAADRTVTPSRMCETMDGGFLITGSANYGYPSGSDVYLVKADSTGDTLWTTHHGGNSFDKGYFVHETESGEIMVASGYAQSSPTAQFYALKFESALVGVGEEGENVPPGSFALLQNYPNPFNPVTRISFRLPREEMVSLTVFNVLGNEVTTLVDRVMEQGRHSVEWDASAATSGVYFYRLTAGTFSEVRMMALVR